MIGKGRTILAVLLIFSVVFVYFSGIVPVQGDTLWNVQIVDTNGAGFTGGECPIVIDSKNNPHIAYTARKDNKDYVMYADWNGSRWNTQTVDIGTLFDLKLDNNDNPHLVYMYGPGGLRYASRTGSNWSIQVVDQGFMRGFGSVALDSSANPHIAYSENSKVLKYASQLESKWSIETLDSQERIWPVMSFEFGADNIPYILYGTFYMENSSINVKMAVKKYSNWIIQTVASNTTSYGNIVLDSMKFPHFYYTEKFLEPDDTIVVRQASWNGSDWNIQSVSSAAMGFLALDFYDNPSLAYIQSYEDVIYVSWTGIAWRFQTVNSDLSAIIKCRLAVDANGNPHISYLAKPPEATLPSEILYLMYATAEASDSVPVIEVLSIYNNVYNTSTIPLEFKIDEPASQIAYNLDGKENVTIKGNTTLTDLTNGNHSITIYATDETGNIGASETIHFAIDVTDETGNNGAPETTQAIDATFLTVIVATVVIVGVSLLRYFKKHK